MKKQKSLSLLPIKRKWEKVVEPILQYQRTNNNLDFAVDFFYQLERMIDKGYKIRLNIPHTLTGAHDNFMQTLFKSEDQMIGDVILTPSFSKSKFEVQVENSIKQATKKIKVKQNPYFQNEKDDIALAKLILLPFVVIKQKISQEDLVFKNINKICNSYEYKKISTIDSSQVVQSYIYTRNMYASITRYFYSIDDKKCKAYKIQNYEGILCKKKSKALWRVQQSSDYSCHFVKIMHQNKSFSYQTENVVKLIEKYFDKEVIKLVIDWVSDSSNRYYLIDVKEVQLKEKQKKNMITKSLSQLLQNVTCSMCSQSCTRGDITKIVTKKLILDFYHHLAKRDVSLSFRINFKRIGNYGKVCNLCYDLVVAQSKLIQREKEFSFLCNFYKKQNWDLYNIKELGIPTTKKHQWRFFFYLEEIRDLKTIMDGNSKNSVILKFKINNSLDEFTINEPQLNHYQLKIIKIEHFFSEKMNIKESLEKMDITATVYDKLKNNPIGEGCVHGIRTEQQLIDAACFQRKYKQMLLFNENSKYATLGFYFGITYDGIKQIQENSQPEQTGIRKINGGNINCLSLPAQWMELIDKNYTQNKENQGKCGIDSQRESNKKKINQKFNQDSFQFGDRPSSRPKESFKKSNINIKKQLNPLVNHHKNLLIL